MPRKGSIYFPNLLSCFILFLSILFPHFWFVVPAAVTILHRSRSKILNLIPWVALTLTAYVALFINTSLTQLDLLSLILFFTEGFCLHWILRRDSKLNGVILIPLVASLVLAVIVYGVSGYVGLTKSYSSWADLQVSSNVFPYFFRIEDWPESLEGFYRTVLMPVLTAGIFAWFACMMAMAFFVNGVIESLIRGTGRPRRRHRSKVWDEFSGWRAPDSVLFGIFIGLLLLAGEKFVPGLRASWLEVIGWNVAILSLFPVFIQGIAVASYFIPRVSVFLFVVIFTLLVLKPIPVLILAGLTDLWFDFRSRIRTDLE
jgi:hypothetical protein